MNNSEEHNISIRRQDDEPRGLFSPGKNLILAPHCDPANLKHVDETANHRSILMHEAAHHHSLAGTDYFSSYSKSRILGEPTGIGDYHRIILEALPTIMRMHGERVMEGTPEITRWKSSANILNETIVELCNIYVESFVGSNLHRLYMQYQPELGLSKSILLRREITFSVIASLVDKKFIEQPNEEGLDFAIDSVRRVIGAIKDSTNGMHHQNRNDTCRTHIRKLFELGSTHELARRHQLRATELLDVASIDQLLNGIHLIPNVCGMEFVISDIGILRYAIWQGSLTPEFIPSLSSLVDQLNSLQLGTGHHKDGHAVNDLTESFYPIKIEGRLVKPERTPESAAETYNHSAIITKLSCYLFFRRIPAFLQWYVGNRGTDDILEKLVSMSSRCDDYTACYLEAVERAASVFFKRDPCSKYWTYDQGQELIPAQDKQHGSVFSLRWT